MNTERTDEHEIDHWENEGGSLQHRTADIVNPFIFQQRSWIKRKRIGAMVSVAKSISS